MDGIAVVGMACRYPDANSPAELWENVLARRRAFRRIPASRLRLEDYWSSDRTAADRTYVTEAGMIAGFLFDRARFHVSAASYRAADVAHWLALQCAADALADSGWPDGRGLSSRIVGVLVGNTLTGDQSRACAMRLRWPYVRRILRAALTESGMTPAQQAPVLERAALQYKRPFPEIDAETLAGWLSNTIAGRICNHFGFQGGGYVVDGACASSLLAVCNACTALATGDLDVALAGGVDLSLDPFELVGFARAGALAAGDMRVFDAAPQGFLPGEGCGFVALMREADAVAGSHRIYAVIRGWGISSDGQGGLTRPEPKGQRLALDRAYRRAAYGVDTVGYFEGHGTGTAIGDQVEIATLVEARASAGARTPAAVGSVKANIGHTKAAAGVAGLIKAACALHRQIVPPTTGCPTPRAELIERDRLLEVRNRAEPWPPALPLRAGVSAMGFGGINAHVTLEGAARRRFSPSRIERRCEQTEQDAELILLSAPTHAGLLARLQWLAERASALSRSELVDLCVHLQRADERHPHRAGVVCETPADLRAQVERLLSALREDATLWDADAGLFAGASTSAPRIAFAFPGQGSPAHRDGGRWVHRFARVRSLYGRAGSRELSEEEAASDTRVAQEAISRAALAGLRVMARLGIDGDLAVGHSLGELVALHWAGAFDERALLRLARQRGRLMAQFCPPGSMASLKCSVDRAAALLTETSATVAAMNAADQTVVAGTAEAIREVLARARRTRLPASTLPVKFAFHSPAMQPAVAPFETILEHESFMPVRKNVISTVTGRALDPSVSVSALLLAQLLQPVRFVDAAAEIVRGSDLAIEVGPGSGLTRLLRQAGHPAALSVDACGGSLGSLLRVVAAAYVMGAPVRTEALAAGRFARAFSMELPVFFSSPCEDAAADAGDDPETSTAVPPAPVPLAACAGHLEGIGGALALVAERAELPADTIRPEHRLLSDLHFNSISAAQLVLDLAARLGVAPPAQPTAFSDASIQEVVDALTQPGAAVPVDRATGVEAWVRRFRPSEREEPRRAAAQAPPPGDWRFVMPADHPLTATLRDEAALRPCAGTIVCLPSVPRTEDWVGLLAAARDAARSRRRQTFVVVHDRGGGMGVAATLAEEAPEVVPVAIQVPFDAPLAGRWVVDEAIAADGATRVSLDHHNRRTSLVFAPVSATEPSAPPVSSRDVLVVTGGARGITAECALALASRTGAAVGLIGRANPDADREVSSTLARFRGAAIRVAYERADLLEAESVKRAVDRIGASLGTITGIIHGAAVNDPVLLADSADADFVAALGAKVRGAELLIDALDMSPVRLLVAFGSIIARSGMRGEASYATANEALRLLIDRVGDAYPRCRCLTLEWSVWSGTGMGDRLGGLVSLERRGVWPMTIDQGVTAFVDALCDPAASGSCVVMGRCGHAVTIDGPALPLARFVEAPAVWYPGIEIVADSDVTLASDPYLHDHVLDGAHVLPAVVGLEAMAQAAAALAGAAPDVPVQLRDVRFDQPILVPADGQVAVRVAAVTAGAATRAALRSDATGFAVDHFALTCEWDRVPAPAPARMAWSHGALLDAQPLYGALFFQRGTFRRVAGFRHLDAHTCIADILPPAPGSRFGAYHADALWLGDPGVRDAALHAIQACIPTSRLVPTAIGEINICRRGEGPRQLHAVERWARDGTYVFDVSIVDETGDVLETWRELQLRRVGPVEWRGALPRLLLRPWMVREWERNSGGPGGFDGSFAPGVSGLSLLRELSDTIVRRADGRPVSTATDLHGSAAHDRGETVAVVGAAPLGCDLQHIAPRSRGEWQGLLAGGDAAAAEYIAGVARESYDAAATRLWSAREALMKCGVARHAPLLVDTCEPPCVRLRAATHVLATVRIAGGGAESAFALAMTGLGGRP